MFKTDKRIDAYIAKSQDFAKPILTHIRELIHKACPDAEETMKWSFPHFEYYGGTVCSMASFKQHCAFTFRKAKLLKDNHKIFPKTKEAMGHLGQIKGLGDLPADKIMIEYIKEAAKLNKDGVKLPSKKPKEKKELVIPDYFTKALRKNKRALKTYNDFSYSHKREYLEYVTEAKTGETRNKRLAVTIDWLAEGKDRNWKYRK
jgi:uncharacterized protein YdeI (YjbR/CyaY-like superfamily)